MNHNFSKAKTGDWAFGVYGWKKIEIDKYDALYPVKYAEYHYTINGFPLRYERRPAIRREIMPTLFLEPPAEFNVSRPPEEYYNMQKVLVSNQKLHYRKRYYKEYREGKHYCYACGTDSWTASERDEASWKFIKPWKEK